MMSRPDFLAKQVVFIESKKSIKMRFQNSNLVVVDDDTITVQHSIHRIFVVFVMGELSITSVLIKQAKKYGIPILFLTYKFKTYHTICVSDNGNYLLRQKQYLLQDSLKIAKWLVLNKAKNQLYLLKSIRYKTEKETKRIEKVKSMLIQIPFAKDSQELLGIEGTISKLYFSTYFKNSDFKGRTPRCRLDMFNLLLDIGYHYLFNYIDAHLQLYGFDTFCGVYHKLFFQRKSLVCDIIEPFRPIIDRRIRKSYNLKQISIDHFGVDNGQYYLKREYGKQYATLFVKEILAHKEQIFLYVQAYYRAFMKDKVIEQYPEFVLQ